MKTTFKILLALIAIILSANVFGQHKKQGNIKYTGSVYVLNDDVFVPFKYTRSYSSSGNNFITTYQVYDPRNGRLYQIITATHFVSEKKIVVEIKDANSGIFTHINTEETTYDTPSLSAFGFRGSAGMIGGDRVPNQLMVKFKNNKFDYIKVINVNATESGTENYKAYVLDEKN